VPPGNECARHPETLFQSVGARGETVHRHRRHDAVEKRENRPERKISAYLEWHAGRLEQEITIRHLLSHTSGVGDVYSRPHLRGTIPGGRSAGKKAASACPSISHRARNGSTVNTGYACSSTIIHKVTRPVLTRLPHKKLHLHALG